MKPTEARIKEFWEGCLVKEENEGGYCWWRDNNDELIIAGYDSLLPIDLNSLFKYAVPKLVEITAKFRASATIGRAIVKAILDSKDPALALFWALDKARRVK